MNKILYPAFVFISCMATSLLAQKPGATAEDSLNNSQHPKSSTIIGGYGNAFYQRDFNAGTSTIDLERMVLFVGHTFNDKFSFFSELEVEDAKVTGGQPGGEVAFEQAYVKMDINHTNYFVAGLFLPSIGILNEKHLPNTFNGNERTAVETSIIPSTWRELGIGYYGSFSTIPLHYSAAIVNGLNAAAFEHGSGIREGRYEGRLASGNALAITGAAQYYAGNLKFQLSGYYGGSTGLSKHDADTLQLESGVFGTPVALGEFDMQFESKGFTAKLLGTYISIPGAYAINRAYKNNTPASEYGGYAELAYNIFETIKKTNNSQLIAFTRYEMLDMNAGIPSNGIIDGKLAQSHFVAGLGYLPIKNVVIKADVHLINTGSENPALVLNPNTPTYQKSNTFANLGIGFSF
jgi:hypothetical protein